MDSQRRRPGRGLRSVISRGLRRNRDAGGINSVSPGALRARIEVLEQRLLLAVTPVINEFMASNHNTINDEDGASSDWIEIYNPSDQSLNLDGYFLTDDAAVLDKWRMPAATVSPPGRT